MTRSPLTQRAYEIFAEALDLPDAARTDFLEVKCGADQALRLYVEGLLGVAARDGVETGALSGAGRMPEESLVGQSFGRFRLIEVLGRGGMGVVYRAERTFDVKQQVAVKVVAHVFAGLARARFEREAQFLARLEHPNVARLIDAGFEDDRPWIAMEFVPGQPIDAYCKSRPVSVEAIVRLVAQLASAVAAAHRLFVVHSDIKPANVLVTADGQPKLIDFGIATALREAGPERARTVQAGLLFSPNYAAPEQVSGEPVTVGTDVYGLGALAYRLLTGVPIHAEAKTPIEYLTAVTQRDVKLASRSLQEAGGAPAAVRVLRGDLDAILCKALERDPARRYASAADLQADLQRYLDGRTVRARAPSVGYRLGKFVRRNAVAVGLSTLLVASLIGGGLYSAIQARHAALARDMAARRGEFLESLLASADPTVGRRDITVAELLDRAAGTADRELGKEPLVEASLLSVIAGTDLGLARMPEGLAANERALALLDAAGGSAVERGRALTQRADLYRLQGDWAQAEPAVRAAVALLRPAHALADLCYALDVLGAVLGHTNRERDAEAVFREEIAIEAAGDEKLKALRRRPYTELGILFGELGRYPEAEHYAHEAYLLAKQALPENHPEVLEKESVWASTLATLDGPRAEPVMRDVIARQTQVLGAGHRSTLLNQMALANILTDLRRWDEAAATALGGARGLEALLGTDNLYTWGAWNAYGNAACHGHQEPAGLAALRRVESARRRLYPAGHWLLYSTELAIGACLAQMHDYRGAEPVLIEATEGLERVRGSGFLRTQDGYRSLEELYLATARPADATRIAAKIEQHVAPSH